jgi:hypothetical protein
MIEATRKQLNRILHSDDFEAVIKLSAEIMDKWHNDNVIGKDQFETLKLLFIREGKLQGLREFLNALENPE